MEARERRLLSSEAFSEGQPAEIESSEALKGQKISKKSKLKFFTFKPNFILRVFQ